MRTNEHWAYRDQGEKLSWADEVFISKADFDDKKQRMSDLEGQVHILLWFPSSILHIKCRHLQGLYPMNLLCPTTRWLLQVHDVKMQNEYNLRLKDAAMNDRVRELTEKHAAEVEAAEAARAALQQEKDQQQASYEEKLKDAAEHQQVLCTALLLLLTVHACNSLSID